MSNLGTFLIVIVAAVVLGIGIYNLVTDYSLKKYVARTVRDPKTRIMKGAEPIFLKNASSRKAALLIHGFIGSPTDYGDLPQTLYRNGYTVSVPLLPGHGTDPRDFAKTTAEELQQFVLREYKRMKSQYDEVVLVGFSMGAALSVLTAMETEVDRLVLVSPYLKISHQWYYILPTEFYQKVFMNVIPFTYRPVTFKQVNNKLAIPSICDYDYVSLKGGEAAILVAKRARAAVTKLPKIPMLVLHSKSDKAADFKEAERVAKSLNATHGNVQFVSFVKSNHILFWDHDAKVAEAEVLKFLL